MSTLDRPEWDDFFMSMAFLVAQRSIDQSTKHGCVVVSPDKTVLSVGYNSPPRDCFDEMIPQERPLKYIFFIHAEVNAILNATRHGTSLDGSTFYITGFPCSRCFRDIVNVGAKRIIYGHVTSKCIDKEDLDAVKLMNKSSRSGYDYDLAPDKIELISMKDLNGDRIEGLLNRTIKYVKERRNPSV